MLESKAFLDSIFFCDNCSSAQFLINFAPFRNNFIGREAAAWQKEKVQRVPLGIRRLKCADCKYSRCKSVFIQFFRSLPDARHAQSKRAARKRERRHGFLCPCVYQSYESPAKRWVISSTGEEKFYSRLLEWFRAKISCLSFFFLFFYRRHLVICDTGARITLYAYFSFASNSFTFQFYCMIVYW